jgi:hypothetical protein
MANTVTPNPDPDSVSEPGPGRVVVRNPSPAFGGDLHLNSVEVNLEP